MWSVSGLFVRLIDPDHLSAAATLTVCGKRRRADVAWFLFRREEVLAAIATALADGTWRPRGYERVTIRDPKPRVISRVPIEDRVVHTALVSLLEPVLTRSLRPEAMACRPGRGTHRSVLRLLGLLRQHHYALHLDIRAYFPSIDRNIVRALLARRVRDRPFLAVVDQVLEAGAGLYADPEVRAWARLPPDWPPPDRGLPIGAYTSQVFAAHLYLDGLDHFVKRDLKIPGYLRYVDDLFLFADSRAMLREARGKIACWLAMERGLRLKHPEARVLSCAGHLDGLGYRMTRAGVSALPRAIRRMQRRVVRWMARVPGPEAARSLASTAGVVMF